MIATLGIISTAPTPKTSTPGKQHKVYPYLLRNKVIDRPNQVWASDITYVPLRLDQALFVWAMRKFKRFRGYKIRAIRWLHRLKKKQPYLFVHWMLANSHDAGMMGPSEPRGSRWVLRAAEGEVSSADSPQKLAWFTFWGTFHKLTNRRDRSILLISRNLVAFVGNRLANDKNVFIFRY